MSSRATSPWPPVHDLGYYARKYAIAALVLATFLGYAVHDRSAYAAAPPGDAAPATLAPAAMSEVPATPTVRATSSPTAVPQPSATAAPTRPPAEVAGPVPPARTATPAAPPTRPPPPGRPTPVPRVTAAPTPQGGQYKNGTFVGPAARTVYGPVQVQAVIEKGRIFDIQFLTYPQARRTSVQINQQVVPILRNEALQIQSANVHAITGATLTVDAFIESLNGALAQARP